MKGLYYHGARDIRYETLPDPQIKDPSDILVRMTGCSICGSDLHIYAGHMPHCDFSVGHEAVGEVMEVGSAVRTLKPGDEVIVSAAIGCGECRQCLSRNVMQCEKFYQLQSYGIGWGYEGLQSEAFVVPHGDTNAMKIPEGISHDQALMLTDMVPTAWLGVHNAEVKPGQTVVVVGLGPIGLTAVEIALNFGAARVIAVGGRRQERMEIAREMGAIPVPADAALDMIMDLTNGLGADSAIEAAGADAAVHQCIKAVRRGGIVSMIGSNFAEAFPFPLMDALLRNIVFKPALCSSSQFWHQSIPLIREGKLRPERMITHRVDLESGVEAYRISTDGEAGVLKTIITP
ncbi:MAG TPA: alcohol dehydrogenase catalytic domain-containing protein [Sphingobium sp.]|nr:alcohol dehydrogenase catalytic domain-containing protein [Sphingobium sp.]